MTDRNTGHGQQDSYSADDTGDPAGNTLSPLPGELGIPDVSARPPRSLSRKGLLALGLLIVSLIGVSAMSIERLTKRETKSSSDVSQRASERPAAATTEPRKLELIGAPMASSSAAAAFPRPTSQIPALVPTADEIADGARPIALHRTAQSASVPARNATVSPEDAPVLLVSSQALPPHGVADRTDPDGSGTSADHAEAATPSDALASTASSLRNYQRQLQGMLDTLGHHADGAAPATTEAGVIGIHKDRNSSAMPPANTPAPMAAALLPDRSLVIPKGTAFTCALTTKMISVSAGEVGCQVLRNVYGDDGRVLLIERGSHLDGNYPAGSIRPGVVRIPVVWNRLRTPLGVVINLESPSTGPLGEGGIDGYVDNRWSERIGAALLLSLIDDSVQLVIQDQVGNSGAGNQANTVVLPSTTANTSKLAEKVLDSTINIPPLIYRNQGGIVGIVVSRDIDFSSVYELLPSDESAVAVSAVATPSSSEAASVR